MIILGTMNKFLAAIAVALLCGVAESHRTCGSAEKTSKLMEKDENYRLSRALEHKRAMIFSQRMKMKQDHSFRKFKNLDKIHTKNEGNNGEKGSKRSLKYSEYDDKIDKEPVIYIPIVFHVLYDTSDHNLGNSQLDSQVDVLNKDFRALNDEIVDNEVPSIWLDRVGDAKIQFYIHETNRVAISDASTTCLDESLMKQTYYGGSDAVDPKHYLNIWICDITTETGSTTLGYAYQPCLLDTVYEWQDGVVLHVNNVGSRDYDDGTFYFGDYTFDLGRTATHEVAHWLNLDHIWGGSTAISCYETDHVSDTPSSLEANYGCPDDTTNTCTETDPEEGTDLRDMYENYMDYTDDECMFLFTEEQVWRMRSVLSGDGCRKEIYYDGAQLEANQTFQPSSQRATSATFTCYNGCPIAEEYIDDQYCDCSQCEDETYWTCDNCSLIYGSGCPSTCGDFVYCSGNMKKVSLSLMIGLLVATILH